MQLTSAEASKMLRKLNEERMTLLNMEAKTKTYVASTNEDASSLAPEYSYPDTAKALADLDSKIRKVRHAINVFNTTHTVGDSGMTIDEVLVAMPQITDRRDKLLRMKDRLPKTRLRTTPGVNVVEYEYTNYNINDVKKDYDDLSAQLTSLQLALDKVNNMEKMEIDI